MNDLIFNITNFAGITNDEDEEIKEDPDDPTEEAISWLWAVEDLGATDDFDFNDMVMKITSVTMNKSTDNAEGENTTGTTTEMYKKVTFTPLCAGGTLPLYVQYTKDGKTYTLKPGGVFKESGLSGIPDEQISEITSIEVSGENADEGSEIHKWFGDGCSSLMMINTARGQMLSAKSCVLYLKDFSIDGSFSKKGTQGGMLTVYVRDDREHQNTDDIADSEGGWNIEPVEKGKVSQMFIIHDANTKWRWPVERTHITEAYSQFKSWVNGNEDSMEWYLKGSTDNSTVVPRFDLGEEW